MKKHLFGLGIFGFIIVTFAAAFALLNAPIIPSVDEVRRPVKYDDKRKKCSKYTNDISFDVTAAQYDLESGKFITSLKLNWNGTGKPPENVFVWAEFYASGDSNTLQIGKLEVIKNPFKDSNSGNFVIESTEMRSLSRDLNLYAKFEISRSKESLKFGLVESNLTEPKQVLFVHGADSQNKK